jgi:hypothetical protein
MTPEQTVLLAILAAEDVPSRTMLQKLVYLAARRRQASLGFVADPFGPYSEPVAQAVGALIRAGVVAERDGNTMESGGSELDAVPVGYHLTDLGHRMAADEIDEDTLVAGRNVLAAAHEHNAFSVGALSWAALVAHLEDSQGDRISVESAPRLAAMLGWTIRPEDAQNAGALVDSLDRDRVGY